MFQTHPPFCFQCMVAGQIGHVGRYAVMRPVHNYANVTATIHNLRIMATNVKESLQNIKTVPKIRSVCVSIACPHFCKLKGSSPHRNVMEDKSGSVEMLIRVLRCPH